MEVCWQITQASLQTFRPTEYKHLYALSPNKNHKKQMCTTSLQTKICLYLHCIGALYGITLYLPCSVVYKFGHISSIHTFLVCNRTESQIDTS